jgi:acyl carrier protein
MGLEKEFDLAISDAVAEEFQTIRDIEAFLQRHSNAK